MSLWVRIETVLLNVTALVMVMSVAAMMTIPILGWLWLLRRVLFG